MTESFVPNSPLGKPPAHEVTVGRRSNTRSALWRVCACVSVWGRGREKLHRGSAHVRGSPQSSSRVQVVCCEKPLFRAFVDEFACVFPCSKLVPATPDCTIPGDLPPQCHVPPNPTIDRSHYFSFPSPSPLPLCSLACWLDSNRHHGAQV